MCGISTLGHEHVPCIDLTVRCQNILMRRAVKRVATEVDLWFR
jgi:hypothetical protein